MSEMFKCSFFGGDTATRSELKKSAKHYDGTSDPSSCTEGEYALYHGTCGWIFGWGRGSCVKQQEIVDFVKEKQRREALTFEGEYFGDFEYDLQTSGQPTNAILSSKECMHAVGKMSGKTVKSLAWYEENRRNNQPSGCLIKRSVFGDVYTFNDLATDQECNDNLKCVVRSD